MDRGFGECHNAPFRKKRQMPKKNIFVNILYNNKRKNNVLRLSVFFVHALFLLLISIFLVEGLRTYDVSNN